MAGIIDELLITLRSNTMLQPKREERIEVSWIAVIRVSNGNDIPCTVKDVSFSGMKLIVDKAIRLPEKFIVKIVGRELIFQVKNAWRRDHSVGVIVEKIAKIPAQSISKIESDNAALANLHQTRLDRIRASGSFS